MRGPASLIAVLAALAMAGCDDAEPGNVAVPATPAASAPVAAPMATPKAAMTPAETDMDFSKDKIERGVTAPPPPPAARPAPFAVDGVTRNFVDPPLPAELEDDGGLKPLPRRKKEP